MGNEMKVKHCWPYGFKVGYEAIIAQHVAAGRSGGEGGTGEEEPIVVTDSITMYDPYVEK